MSLFGFFHLFFFFRMCLAFSICIVSLFIAFHWLIFCPQHIHKSLIGKTKGSKKA